MMQQVSSTLSQSSGSGGTSSHSGYNGSFDRGDGGNGYEPAHSVEESDDQHESVDDTCCIINESYERPISFRSSSSCESESLYTIANAGEEDYLGWSARHYDWTAFHRQVASMPKAVGIAPNLRL